MGAAPHFATVDTWRAAVARESYAAGAVVGNDISGFADPNYLHVAAEAGAGFTEDSAGQVGHIRRVPIERGQADGELAQAMEGVYTEAAAPHQLGQLFVGRRDDLDVDVLLSAPAQRRRTCR